MAAGVATGASTPAWRSTRVVTLLGLLDVRVFLAGLLALAVLYLFADIGLVVLTHLPLDHVGWNVRPDGTPLFPSARYVVPHAELAAAEAAQGPTYQQQLAPLPAAEQVPVVDGEVEVLPGVRLLPTPGHTVGHQSVLVDDVLLAGDTFVHPAQLLDPTIDYAYDTDPTRCRDPDPAADARRPGATLAGTPVTWIPRCGSRSLSARGWCVRRGSCGIWGHLRRWTEAPHAYPALAAVQRSWSEAATSVLRPAAFASYSAASAALSTSSLLPRPGGT